MPNWCEGRAPSSSGNPTRGTSLGETGQDATSRFRCGLSKAQRAGRFGALDLAENGKVAGFREKHVLDGPVITALAADPEAVAGEAFNVGSDSGNYRIGEIAETVGRTFDGAEVTVGQDGGDTRSYRISVAKIAERGARQMRDLFRRIGLTEAMFLSSPFTRLPEMRCLRETGQIDDRLFWTPLAA